LPGAPKGNQIHQWDPAFDTAASLAAEIVSVDVELSISELFFHKEELMPLWLRLRQVVEAFGPDVRIRRRGPFIEVDRKGAVFALVEPTADHELEVGLHNPGLPTDKRFRPADGWGPRRITHRISVPEDAELDDELTARLKEAYYLAWEGEPR
jgi:hypothetical protein